MGFFEDLLSQHVTDEADRSVILKYPELKQTLEMKLANEVKNQAWLARHWDETENKTYREKELETALATANESLAASAARGNADMTFEEMEVNLKNNGYIKAADVDARLTAARNEVTQVMSRHDLGAMRLAGEAANYANKYRNEFGEDMNVTGFTTQVANSTLDTSKPDLGLSSIYDQFVASQRAVKQTRELETLKTNYAAELAAATAKAAEEARRSTLMEIEANGGRGMPVDQGRGSNIGWMQQKQIERNRQVDADGNQKVPIGPLGSGAAADAAYTQYIKDKAEGKVLTM